MRRLLLLLIAIGCTDDDEPLLVDTDLVEAPLSPDCSGVEGTFVAIDLDVEALDRAAAEDLGGERFTIELAPDGTFVSLLVTEDEVTVTEGTWSISDGDLVIAPFLPGIGGPTRFECRLEGGQLSVYGFTTFDFDGDGSFVDAQFLGDLFQLQ